MSSVPMRGLRSRIEALRDSVGGHHLAARGRSVDMAVAALLVAQLGDVHLQRVDREWRQLHASTMQYRLEVMAGARGRRPNGNRQAQSTSLFRCLSICTECTSVIPACITAAPCTASITLSWW